MKFKNVEQDEEGNVNFDVEASREEVAFLVNHAVHNLITAGVIALNDAPEQEVELRETLQ